MLRTRLRGPADVQTVQYGETIQINNAKLSLHPAGHMLGSCQVRVEVAGEVWVFSGDYKVAADPTCTPFEPVPCHTFITEATFANPHFAWPDQAQIWREIEDWWRTNRAWGRASIVYSYALGKAQRILAGLRNFEGPLFTHHFVEIASRDYRASGVEIPPTQPIDDAPEGTDWSQGIVIAPPNARGGKWMRRVGTAATAFASGWMCLRGALGRHGVDHGFVLSDHADWAETLQTVAATGAENILVTHGAINNLVLELRRLGYAAAPLNPQEKESGFHAELSATPPLPQRARS